MASGDFDGISDTLYSMAAGLKETNVHSAAKLSCLLSCVNSVPFEGSSPNIHTLLIGSPSSSKTQICQPLASIVHPSAFLDGKGARAKESTHNEDSVAGQPVSLSDALASSQLVIVDEALSMPPGSLGELNAVTGQQASVREKGAEATRNIDVSVILTCSPPGLWNLHSSIFDKLHAFGPSYLTRFNTFLIVPGARERKPPVDVYGDVHLAAYLKDARERKPDFAPECDVVLDSKLDNMRYGLFHGWFGGKDDDNYISQMAALKRNASAFAKLLMRDTVDSECAAFSTFMLECSLMSFRFANDEHYTTPPTVVIHTPPEAATKTNERGSDAALEDVRETIDSLRPLVIKVIEATEPSSGAGHTFTDTWETLQSLRGLLERTRNECAAVIERSLKQLDPASGHYPYPPSEKVKDRSTPAAEDARRARLEGAGDAGARTLAALDRLPSHVEVAAMAIAESLAACDEHTRERALELETAQSLRRLVDRARNECGELVEAALARLLPSP